MSADKARQEVEKQFGDLGDESYRKKLLEDMETDGHFPAFEGWTIVDKQ